MKQIIVFFIAFFVTVSLGIAQDFRMPTRPKYDYTRSTHGEPFAYEIKGGKAIEVNGVAVCEYRMASGKNLRYKASEFDVEFSDKCPDLGFSFLTMWEPYTKLGKSKVWVCSYGWGSHNGYVFRFMKSSCPDVIIATSVGAWLEELNFGQCGFEVKDFASIPQVRARYNLNTLENNPKFAERVKYRAAGGLIYKLEP